jgi:hypothetical protein
MSQTQPVVFLLADINVDHVGGPVDCDWPPLLKPRPSQVRS